MVSIVETCFLSGATLGQIFVAILAIVLVVRAASFYGSVRDFIKNKLAVLSLGYFVFAFLFMTFWIALFSINSHAANEWVVDIYGILFGFNVCWFYITIIYRVYISFKNNNEYKLSRLELICLALFVLWQFGVILFLIVYNSFTPLEAGILFIIVLCIDIAFNIAILYVFLKRLYQMIVSLDESFETLIINMDEIRMSSMSSNSEIDKHFDDNINHKDKNDDVSQSDLISDDEIEIKDKMQKISMQETEVVNMMAKISLLTIVSEIFINVFLIMIAYLNVDQTYGDNAFNQTYAIVEQLALMIGLCLNCFTLYATFIFNDDHYMKCCGFCHKNLKKCCVICVTRQALRHRR